MDISHLLERSMQDHDHLCPRQILGVRIGLAGMKALGFAVPPTNKQLLVISETDGCFVDGVTAATGRTVGHRTLRLEDYGKVAATFVDTRTGSAVRVAPRLEAIYLDGGYEIGTNSVRLFVAFHSGLPFDTTGQEIYLPQSATDILKAKGNLSAEQVSYIEQYTVMFGESLPVTEPQPARAETSSTTSGEYTVKGKTTFGELISWGMSQEVIEQLIGASMPDPAMTLKDYASANELNFETLKPAVQAEMDKVKP